jgi:hypothetical protein
LEEEQHHLSPPLALSDSCPLLLLLFSRWRHERKFVVHFLSLLQYLCVLCFLFSTCTDANDFISAAAAASQLPKLKSQQRAR